MTTANGQTPAPFMQDAPAVISTLGTDAHQGLTSEQAAHNLNQYGPNAFTKPKPESMLSRIVKTAADPMLIMLMIAAAITLGVNITRAMAGGHADILECVGIFFAIALSVTITVVMEGRSAKAFEALNDINDDTTVTVVRDGEVTLVSQRDITIGDVLQISTGDKLPADARLIESNDLTADESALTGESVPSAKATDAVFTDPKIPVADRTNMLYSGCFVTAGNGRAVVTAVGDDTEFGKIARELRAANTGMTPLQEKLAKLGKVIAVVGSIVAALVFVLQVTRFVASGTASFDTISEAFITSITLIVAAVPEGLPTIVAACLAVNIIKMSKQNALVKKMVACETIGCINVICSDKTGTLTQNRMTVVDVWTPRSGERALALTIGALCSDAALAWKGREPVSTGDPTETALVDAAAREGLDKNGLEGEWPRRGELPFDSERKLMTTVHQRPGGGWRVCVKGAPDVLARRCRLDSAAARRLESRNEAMAGKALRVLGVAYKDLAMLPRELNSAALEQGLTFVGLIGMIDPPRPEVRTAVEQCYAAGIKPVMITGDHKLTAVAIARELNIYRPGDLALTGEDLDFLPQEVLEQEVEKFSVYARVSPEHKMRIVKAWQARGKVVAMTGDGVNDAPALKVADIGCAMGVTGTDVAKGAADMILTDDNFATIVSAVEQGRGIYANIKKAIHYLLSCNIGEILTIFCATVFHFHQMPLVPVQLLWLNLVTDSLPALALGVEPVEEGVMSQPPRDAHASLFAHGFAFRLAWQGVMVGLLTLAAYFLGEYVLSDPGEAHAAANTMAFATLTLCQLFHAFDVRSERSSLFHIGVFSNPAMNKAFLIGLTMQLAVLCVPPLQVVFSTVPMSPLEWAVVLALAITPVVVCELAKAVSRGRTRRPARAEKVEPACARR